ncbi:MAG: serine/threonine-protein kinase [Isosphaeraceae bacterium]|nr:serine/threonine-protein kinase [Isosphaeraceae bacterium]
MDTQPHEPSTDEPANDPLEAGLRAAFGPESAVSGWGGGSALAAIERDYGIGSHPIFGDAAYGNSSTSPGRYAIAGEIARGGIGVVLKGRDVDLGREVAIKTLRAEHAGNPAMVRRLVEEAQIGGQLQHPGVLPVYEIGLDPERRPYFTMKLVRGETLATLLRDRLDPAQERRRFVTIFEQVCQTVAYAHARGVVHRDLKPSNVMVGAFGEVQVVDWGLAKVLTPGGALAGATAEGSVATVRSGLPGLHSEAGSLLGTPAYMPPEQARGELDGLDERCDVFALGAILCEILTGRPPYTGERAELVRQARDGCLDEAFARLATCGAQEELVGLARSCLAADRKARPRDARAVAEQVSAHLASADERARRAEFDAAVARNRAYAERRARRVTTLAGILTLVVALAGAGGYVQIEHQRTRVAQQRAHVELEMARAVQERAQNERERLQFEQQRVTRLENALTLVRSLQAKGEWILVRAKAAPVRDALGWAEALALTRQAVERTLPFEAEAATRKKTLALIDELKTAEDTLRQRAAFAPDSAPRNHRALPR